MEQYYFLLSSLPALSPEASQVISLEDFLATSRDWLNERDWLLLTEAKLEPVYTDNSNRVVSSWLAWESGLRNAMLRIRSSKSSQDAGQYARKDQQGNDFQAFHEVSELARTASNASNPLEAELLLLKGRWNFLDSLELGHFFDIERLIVYKLKVLLLQRKNQMTVALGQEHYRLAYEAVAATFPLNLE